MTKCTLVIIFNLLFLTCYSIDLDVRDTELTDVLKMIAKASGLNIIPDQTVKGKKVTLKLKGVSTNKALEYICKQNGLTSQRIGNTVLVASVVKIFKTAVFKVKYLDLEEAKNLLTGELGGIGQIQINTATNELVVSSASDNLRRVGSLLKKIDHPPKQVIIEAKIAEVAEEALKQSGFTWSTSLRIDLTEITDKTVLNFLEPLSFGRSPIGLSTLLNMLENQGKATILARPKVSTIS